ncbi:MAG: MmgE/PrpD family protein [Methylobacteriaceae bacterium]|nr:MmgE/PrpD family protein [Methylobacteriaceae bacterium]
MSLVTPGVVAASTLLAEPRPAWLAGWAAFAADLRFDDLDSVLVAQAKLIALDCLGAIAAGMREPEPRALARRLAARGGGAHVAIGAGLRLGAHDAAFVNGVAGTTLELDEGNRFARGHPGIHVLPAALAARAPERVEGRALLRAFVLGYEICARVGAASRLRAGVHPHGTWGVIGAALAAVCLEGADERRIVEAVNVGAALSGAASLRAMLEGATVRNAYAGVAARNGLVAADLVAAGFTGEIDATRSVYDGLIGEGFRPDAMTEALGERWEMRRNYFKRHAACRFTHGALDVAARFLAERGRPSIPSIRSIEIDTYVWAAQLDAPAPANMLAAKFSLPFAVATMLRRGAADVEAFRAAALADAATLDLARRIRVREDAAYTAMGPDKRPARLAIHFADGEAWRGETLGNRGDEADPYAPDEIVAKFMSLAGAVWGEAHAARLVEAVEGLDRAPSLAALDALLSAPAIGDD